MKNYKLLLIILVVITYSCKDKDESVEQLRKPNVLFILVDDLGLHDLSVTGSNFYETPNVDKIANSGFRFTQAYAGSRVCSPSRASIMLGKATARHGITDWIGAASGEEWRTYNRHDKLLPADYNHALPAQDITIAEAMKEAGYTTFFAGKWHLGSEGSSPEDHGFDINKGGFDKGSPMGGYFSPFNNPKLENHENGENLSLRLANETASFLEQHKDTSFFAFLSFYAVHGPIQTTQQKWDKYKQKAETQGIKDHGYEMEKVLPIRTVQDNPVYGGLVETMDEAVGIVTSKLEELGLTENTIVIFTSDNGGVASGDNYSTSNLPQRGGKGYQWEGGIREPYFIKVPWLKAEIYDINTPVTGMDLFPTILDLAGIPLLPDQHMDGVSLLPLMDGKEIAERTLYWHYPHYGNQGGEPSSIIREGDWKLIHYWEDDRNELYNLANDVSEQEDLATQNGERVHTMETKLFKWLEEVNAQFPIPDKEYDVVLDNARDQKIRNELLPNLEKQRMDMFKPDWQPNADWWGSNLTID
ncbi:MAG: sulfatase [Thalassobius sp.]|nr:sulfatase [Thalassovita sp.]